MKIIEARMFDKSEYGFNNFIILDTNYNNSNLEEVIVEKNGLRYFELSTKTTYFASTLKEHNIDVAYFEYKNGEYQFNTDIPNSIIQKLIAPTHNKIYRQRYTIDENMVLLRDGFADIEQNVYKNKMMSKAEFLETYNTLPKRNFSFSKLEI